MTRESISPSTALPEKVSWGRIADLRESGMGATVFGELSQGEFIALQFSIPSVSLELRACVCHRRGYFYGFEFLIVSDMQRERTKLAGEEIPIKHPHASR